MTRTRSQSPTLLAAFLSVAAVSGHCQESAPEKKWAFETSLYGLAAGMSGDVAVGAIHADVDVPFSDVLDNLEFGAMGSARVRYGRWSVKTDVIYMGLGVSKGPFSVDVDQWMVEPSIGYEISQYIELLAGARYTNIATLIEGPLGRNPSGTRDWAEPNMGAAVTLPITKSLAFRVEGNVGGIVTGSDITWQAYPHLNWSLSRSASIQIGYRWIYSDFEEGSGRDYFLYDVMSQGPQAGFTWRF